MFSIMLLETEHKNKSFISLPYRTDGNFLNSTKAVILHLLCTFYKWLYYSSILSVANPLLCIFPLLLIPLPEKKNIYTYSEIFLFFFFLVLLIVIRL